VTSAKILANTALVMKTISKIAELRTRLGWGIDEPILMLAPLAGVSDHPFRRMSPRASLSFVEMLSSEAILNGNAKTYSMMERHPEERILGVQLTGAKADRIAKAVGVLNKQHFDVIDINMGCPVRKVVGSGCGAALLRDPEHVYQTVKASLEATDKVLSVKIRLGWDRSSINVFETVEAIEKAGAAWVTIHGRTRSDDYGVPVDLDLIARVKRHFAIPIIGNGNVFDYVSYRQMVDATGGDGVMISRGALGNPWVFDEILTKGEFRLSLTEWAEGVSRHIDWARNTHPVCFRKHLLWYLKGWPGVKGIKDTVNTVHSFTDAMEFIHRASEVIKGFDQEFRELKREVSFFEPKFDMDRKMDEGLGHLDLAVN
jgi:tRNA-dihydrouridine synthase B